MAARFQIAAPSLWLGAAGLALVAIALVLGPKMWRGEQNSTAEAAHTTLMHATAPPPLVEANSPKVRELKATVKQLRAELSAKDEQISKLEVHGVAPVAEPAAERRHPSAEAIDLLDERLFAGRLEGPEVRANERALGEALRGIPSTVKAELACSSALCRVSLESQSAEVSQAAGDIIERLPKHFSGAIALEEGETRRAVFVAAEPGALLLQEAPSAGTGDTPVQR